MVLGRFFQKQPPQPSKQDDDNIHSNISGLGGVAALDGVAVDPRVAAVESPPPREDVAAVFAKKKPAGLSLDNNNSSSSSSKRVLQLEKQESNVSSEAADDLDDDDDDGESSGGGGGDSFLANTEDDVTVDTTTSGALNERIKNDFLKEYRDNNKLMPGGTSEQHGGDNSNDSNNSSDDPSEEDDDDDHDDDDHETSASSSHQSAAAAAAAAPPTKKGSWGWFAKPKAAGNNDALLDAAPSPKTTTPSTTTPTTPIIEPAEISAQNGMSADAAVVRADDRDSDSDDDENDSQSCLDNGCCETPNSTSSPLQEQDDDDDDGAGVSGGTERINSGDLNHCVGAAAAANNSNNNNTNNNNKNESSSSRRMAWGVGGWRGKQQQPADVTTAATTTTAAAATVSSSGKAAVTVAVAEPSESDDENDGQATSDSERSSAVIAAAAAAAEAVPGKDLDDSIWNEAEPQAAAEAAPAAAALAKHNNPHPIQLPPANPRRLGWGWKAKKPETMNEADTSKNTSAHHQAGTTTTADDGDKVKRDQAVVELSDSSCSDGEVEEEDGQAMTDQEKQPGKVVTACSSDSNDDKDDSVRSLSEAAAAAAAVERPLHPQSSSSTVQEETASAPPVNPPRRVGWGWKATAATDEQAAVARRATANDELSKSEQQEALRHEKTRPSSVDISEAESFPSDSDSESDRDESESSDSEDFDSAANSVVVERKCDISESSRDNDESQSSESEHSDVSLRSEPRKSSLIAQENGQTSSCASNESCIVQTPLSTSSETAAESGGNFASVVQASQATYGCINGGSTVANVSNDKQGIAKTAGSDNGWFGKSLTSHADSSSDNIHAKQSGAATNNASEKSLASLLDYSSEKVEPQPFERSLSKSGSDFKSQSGKTRDQSLAHTIDAGIDGHEQQTADEVAVESVNAISVDRAERSRGEKDATADAGWLGKSVTSQLDSSSENVEPPKAQQVPAKETVKEVRNCRSDVAESSMDESKTPISEKVAGKLEPPIIGETKTTKAVKESGKNASDTDDTSMDMVEKAKCEEEVPTADAGWFGNSFTSPSPQVREVVEKDLIKQVRNSTSDVGDINNSETRRSEIIPTTDAGWFDSSKYAQPPKNYETVATEAAEDGSSDAGDSSKDTVEKPPGANFATANADAKDVEQEVKKNGSDAGETQQSLENPANAGDNVRALYVNTRDRSSANAVVTEDISNDEKSGRSIVEIEDISNDEKTDFSNRPTDSVPPALLDASNPACRGNQAPTPGTRIFTSSSFSERDSEEQQNKEDLEQDVANGSQAPVRGWRWFAKKKAEQDAADRLRSKDEKVTAVDSTGKEKHPDVLKVDDESSSRTDKSGRVLTGANAAEVVKRVDSKGGTIPNLTVEAPAAADTDAQGKTETFDDVDKKHVTAQKEDSPSADDKKSEQSNDNKKRGWGWFGTKTSGEGDDDQRRSQQERQLTSSVHANTQPGDSESSESSAISSSSTAEERRIDDEPERKTLPSSQRLVDDQMHRAADSSDNLIKESNSPPNKTIVEQTSASSENQGSNHYTPDAGTSLVERESSLYSCGDGDSDSEFCSEEDDSKRSEEDDSRLPVRQRLPLPDKKGGDAPFKVPSRQLSGFLPAPLPPNEYAPSEPSYPQNPLAELKPEACFEVSSSSFNADREPPQRVPKRNYQNLAMARALIQQQLVEQAACEDSSAGIAVAKPIDAATKISTTVPDRNQHQLEYQSAQNPEKVQQKVPRRNYNNLAMARALVELQSEMLLSDDQDSACFNDEPHNPPSRYCSRNDGDTRAITRARSGDHGQEPVIDFSEGTGPRDSAVQSEDDAETQNVAALAAVGTNEPEENASEESESGSEVESDSESEDGTKPYRLVVKEAPLLRLENVTLATRSKIPENSAQKKARPWGWFGKKTKNENSKEDSGNKGGEEEKSTPHAEPDPHGITETDKADESDIKEDDTTDSPHAQITTFVKENKANEPESKTRPADDVYGGTSEGAGFAKSMEGMLNITSPQSLGDEAPVKEDAGESEKNAVMPELDPMNLSSHASTSNYEEPPLSPGRVAAPLSPTAKLSPPKKKKKKKKGDISTLLEINARKVNRHGDEVSVGTTNFKGGKSSRVVVLTGSNTHFDDHELGERSRPWESTMRKGPKRFTSLPKKSSVDAIGSFAADEIDEELMKIETLGLAEEFFKESTADSKALLPVLAEADESEEEDDEEDKEEEEEDDLGELKEMANLEQKLAAEDTPEVDFDDMWDTVSCDVSTALDFERIKRKKNHEKEKKRQRREQEKDDKANEARRLRLFERRNEKEGQKVTKKNGKQSKLSDEFIDAIHKVFDDGSVNSADSFSDHDASDADRPDDMSADGSCNSLYLRAKQGEDDGDSESGGSRSNKDGASRGDEDMNMSSDNDLGVGSIQRSNCKIGRKNKAGRHGDSGSKARSRSSSKQSKHDLTSSKKKRSNRTEVDSSEIFMAEVRRLKKPKVLTIQTLRQEMVDRRGTSVNLLKKEYVNFRKKRNDRKKSQGDDELQQLDFGALSEKGLGFQAVSFGDEAMGISGEEGQPEEQKPRSDGLGAKLSRWVASEGVTELDDLATVNESPAPAVNLLVVASALARNAVTHLSDVPQDLNNFAKDAGKGINTLGTNVYGAGQTLGGNVAQVGGRAGKTIGSGLGQGAHVIGSGLSHGAHGVGLGIGKGLHTVGQGRNSVAHGVSPIGLPTLHEMPQKADDMNMFTANFSDMPLTSIQEADDDDDFGLLANHTRDHDSDDDDNFSFHSSNSKRSYNGGGVNVGGGSRFKMGKIKAPNLGKTMKKLVPKMPSLKRENSRGKSSNGFMMSDDGYGTGLLG